MSYSAQVVADCYHEAAHAVFFHRAGVEIAGLWVHGQGTIEHRWPDSPPPEQALALAAGCLAGPLASYPLDGEEVLPMAFDDFVATADAASAIADGMAGLGLNVAAEDLRAVWPENFGDDYGDALAMLEFAVPACGGLEACYDAAIEKVRRGFAQRWGEVEAVARALLGAGRLTGAEAVDIIGRAKGTGAPAPVDRHPKWDPDRGRSEP